MSDATYRDALKRAKADYQLAQLRFLTADLERDKSATEMANLRRTIAALSVMCGEPAEEGIGLTEAVRAAMDAATEPLTLSEVKLAVEEQGFDWRTQSDPDASLSSILRRLRDAGEVQHSVMKWKDKSGTPVRQSPVWIGKNARPKSKAQPPFEAVRG